MTIKKKKFMELLVVVLVIVGLIFLNKAGNKFNDELIYSGKFAIGTFVQFSTQLVGFSRSYKYYYYNNNGNKRYSVDSKNMPDKKMRKNIKKGEQFFVLYNEDGASIFFNKPINDSTDFENYVKEFKKLRKQIKQ